MVEAFPAAGGCLVRKNANSVLLRGMALDSAHEPLFQENIPESGYRPVPGSDSFGIDCRRKMYQTYAGRLDGSSRFESDRSRRGVQG